MTELDAGVQDAVDRGLARLAAARVARELDRGEPLPARGGRRRWAFGLGGHPTAVTLVARGPGGTSGRPALVHAEDLEDVDLVVSHDWSGDPLVNLRVVLELLDAVRRRGGPAPLLMLEDLERHPYPIDLSLFGPRARSARPYGHRTSEAGVGQHGTVELGTPLFGGAVLLGFGDPWWREVPWDTVLGVAEFLVLHQFGTARQNVLEGGTDPLLAPAMLDWWTGYGYRTVAGPDLRSDPAVVHRMLAAVAEVLPGLPDDLRGRFGCRVALYEALLEVMARGGDRGELMPAAELTRRPVPGRFPSRQMEALYREALANADLYRQDLEREAALGREVLATLAEPAWRERLAACPAATGEDAEDAAGWAARYRALEAWLAGRERPPEPSPPTDG
jgi:hypothetical protein